MRTTETLPSGRQVKKLEGFKTRRTLADLPAVRLPSMLTSSQSWALDTLKRLQKVLFVASKPAQSR